MDNIQRILTQLLKNRNNNNTTDKEEENLNNESPKSEQSKEGSSIDADVIKGIQAQIASLTQKGKLKKVGMTRPHPLEWDLVPYLPKFKPPMFHTYDDKRSSNQHIYYFRSQIGNVIDNDAIMVKLFIDTLKGVAFDWFRSFPNSSINSWVDLKTQFLSRFYEDDTEMWKYT